MTTYSEVDLDCAIGGLMCGDATKAQQSRAYREYERVTTESAALKEIIRELSELEIAACACPGSMCPGEDVLGRLFQTAGVVVPDDIKALQEGTA